jgi:hypothetical protein
MLVDVHEDAIALPQGLGVSQIQAGHRCIWFDAASAQDGWCDVDITGPRWQLMSGIELQVAQNATCQRSTGLLKEK